MEIYKLWIVVLLVIFFEKELKFANAERRSYYSYPVPQKQLKYPTPTQKAVVCPTFAPTERPREAQKIVERVEYIPPEHLKRDEEMRETIREQTKQIDKKDTDLVDREKEIREQEETIREQYNEIDGQKQVIGRQVETIKTLEEEIRRLRGKPNLGVVLGDKIIEFVMEEKRKVASQQSEGGGEEEVIRRKTQQKITTTVEEDDVDVPTSGVSRESSRSRFSSSSSRLGGAELEDIGNTGANREGTFRETSRSSFSSSSKSTGGSLNEDDEDLDRDSLTRTGGSRSSSSSFSSSSKTIGSSSNRNPRILPPNPPQRNPPARKSTNNAYLPERQNSGSVRRYRNIEPILPQIDSRSTKSVGYRHLPYRSIYPV